MSDELNQVQVDQKFTPEELKTLDEQKRLAESIAAGWLWPVITNDNFPQLAKAYPEVIPTLRHSGIRGMINEIRRNKGATPVEEHPILDEQLAYLEGIAIPATLAQYPRRDLKPLDYRYSPPDYEIEDMRFARDTARVDLFEGRSKYRSVKGAPRDYRVRMEAGVRADDLHMWTEVSKMLNTLAEMGLNTARDPRIETVRERLREKLMQPKIHALVSLLEQYLNELDAPQEI